MTESATGWVWTLFRDITPSRCRSCVDSKVARQKLLYMMSVSSLLTKLNPRVMYSNPTKHDHILQRSSCCTSPTMQERAIISACRRHACVRHRCPSRCLAPCYWLRLGTVRSRRPTEYPVSPQRKNDAHVRWRNPEEHMPSNQQHECSTLFRRASPYHIA